ncbi:hypothetical protein [Microbacterium sp.]|uniref:hypothetical protein n=1 Tax=Microbacterium sp. TaxID=51671 RepID=UPI0028111B20|nr:hypothetical protein [Microbacterium sp.]
MSESYGGGGSGATGTGSQQPSGTIETAKQEAAGVKDTAAEQAGGVVDTAKSEAAAVGHAAKDQVRGLYEQTRTELREQAATQQRRVADGLRSVGGELGTMADNAEGGGIAADLVRQVSTRVEGVAGWIGDRDPGALLGEVKTFARRRPGTFIAIAAVAGLVAGRLTRALADGASDRSDATTGSGGGGTGSGFAGSRLDEGPRDPGFTDRQGLENQAGAGAAAGAHVIAGEPGVTGAATTGSALPGDVWHDSPVDAAIPAAPDGVSGSDVDALAADDAGGTPVYDQTDAANRDTFGEEGRP